MPKTKTKGKEETSRFNDWATANVPILPPDHPDVIAAKKFTGQFVTPKEEWDSWPEDPPTIENIYVHKKGAKRGK